MAKGGKGTMNDLVGPATKGSTPSPIDPIEAAKISSDGRASSPPTASAPAASGSALEPSVPPPVASTSAGKVYEVKNTTKITVSWKGQQCRFSPGDTVSEDSYGDGAVERFREGGLLLEERPTKS